MCGHYRERGRGVCWFLGGQSRFHDSRSYKPRVAFRATGREGWPGREPGGGPSASDRLAPVRPRRERTATRWPVWPAEAEPREKIVENVDSATPLFDA